MLLSIGIPTYNGCLSLKRNLDNLVSIIEKENLQGKVQIVVSDNCSIDDTEAVCRSFVKCKNFQYFRNHENIGYDRNVDNVIRKSGTKYVWLLSDDDSITGNIAEICTILETERPSYLFVNFSNTICLETPKRAKNYKIFNDINDFFTYEQFKNGLISSNIIKTDLWCKYNLERYYGMNWIHFAYLVNVFQNHNYPLIVYYPEIVYQGLGEKNLRANWYEDNNSIFVGIQLLHILKEIKNMNANKKTLSMSRKIITGGYPKLLIKRRLSGVSIPNEFLVELKKILPSKEFFWVWFYSKVPLIWIVKLVVKIRDFIKYDK